MTMPHNISIIGKNKVAEALFTYWKDHADSNVSWNDEQRLAEAELVIETVNLDQYDKRQNLSLIESIAPRTTTILSTSFQWTANELASWLKHPERLVGFAAFDNFADTKLTELAPALQTDPAHLEAARKQLEAIGKETETVDDEPGMVFPRIISLIINESVFAYMEKTARAADIDTAMKKGTNYPYGPLEWVEKVGIENVYAVLEGLHRHLGEERYRPASLLRKFVYAGWGGSGRGFCEHEKKEVKELVK
ncbi:3-hydroxybutyryl-CoA dehydrogenase [Thalassobacillus cyri]|uniref:3-hydroxybutyryl-CoA dehydrogenase n=1 Tax=Thalassobacillus cyri TaxID=571932 RepID=A0A1H3ZDU1_9BACI|nr:3-hydroxyacyl-CoA dehydrogenase family protein [Thalassobacillus cyri]SEA21554.1 3-hydroxybutyryl-CoA dehydrogenase [Thalassobacillus cyri]